LCGNPFNPILSESTTQTKDSSEQRQQQRTTVVEITGVRGLLGSLPLSFGNTTAAGAIGGCGDCGHHEKEEIQQVGEADCQGGRRQEDEGGGGEEEVMGGKKRNTGALANVVSSGVATYYSMWGNKTCSGDARKRDDGFTHDDNYMKLLADGFSDPGRVSSGLTYYVANNGDCLPKIAEKFGLSSWKLLNDVEFITRFYGVLTRLITLKRDTVIEIPTSLCSK
jgi:hypothetical protein